MPGWSSGVVRHGTDEMAAPAQSIRVGNLSFDLEDGSARAISWHGVEAVRAIGCPIRDGNWGTLPAEAVEETVEEEADAVTVRRDFTVGDGALRCALILSADASGTFEASITMTAARDFTTNRAGFSVLHPIAATAGTPLTVRHSDGGSEQSVFPSQILPGQPAFDIAGLVHEIDGVSIDIAFEGEIFEMEDQRNWTDASFKTYCRPLGLPFPYVIAAGEIVTQRIRLTLGGLPSADDAASGGAALTIAESGETVPSIAIAVEPGWQPTEAAHDAVKASGVPVLQVRTGPQHDADYLAESAALARDLGAEVDVELVLAADTAAEQSLADAAIVLSGAGIVPTRLTALPEPYLMSYQPDGAWPDGPTPDDAVRLARAAFPDAALGAGVLTNFTELNRCRPGAGVGDFITHGTCGIVHAADDRSVIETLEALPQVFSSTAALADGRAYRLGLVAIGARSNPYGASVTPNDDQKRRALALADPRQRGLFAAAWAVGAMAATAGHGVDALALAAPVGPFGIADAETSWDRPGFEDDPEARVHPIYHVVRALASASGSGRLSVAGVPDGVAAVAMRTGGRSEIVLANLADEAVSVELPPAASTVVLDDVSFQDAVRDADWLDTAPRRDERTVRLSPLATAFARIEES